MKATKLYIDKESRASSYEGKSFYRLVERLSTPGLSYVPAQDPDSLKRYIICEGLGDATTTDIVIADTVDSALVTKIMPVETHGAFENSPITSVILPDSLDIIGARSFASCLRLTNVVIPASVTTIGYFAFGDCISLTNIYYRGTQAQWDAISKTSGWDSNMSSSCTITYNYKA